MILGNDIVDLHDLHMHRRFATRVLSSFDKVHLASPPRADESQIWLYWAAKEAAFKALHPAGIVDGFRPRDYDIDLKHRRVYWKGLFELHLEFEQTEDYVFALCRERDCKAITQINELGTCPAQEESQKTREFARQLVQDTFSGSHAIPSIQYNSDGAPYLKLGRTSSRLALGLSHHGRYCAVSIPQAQAGRRLASGMA